jgi:hypothetical protein
MDQDTTSQTAIYRYKFRDVFMEQLTNFADKHRYDEVSTFKEAWGKWTMIGSNISMIIEEERYLNNIGYDGDINDKMYKTVRYYLKNKPKEKKEPRKRRKYVSINSEIIETMDCHITGFAFKNHLKPAAAYKNYSEADQYKDMITIELARLCEQNLTNKEAIAKIKKTYKNRYYLQQKA